MKVICSNLHRASRWQSEPKNQVEHLQVAVFPSSSNSHSPPLRHRHVTIGSTAETRFHQCWKKLFNCNYTAQCSPAQDSPGVTSGSGDMSAVPVGHLQENVPPSSTHSAVEAQWFNRWSSQGLETKKETVYYYSYYLRTKRPFLADLLKSWKQCRAGPLIPRRQWRHAYSVFHSKQQPSASFEWTRAVSSLTHWICGRGRVWRQSANFRSHLPDRKSVV